MMQFDGHKVLAWHWLIFLLIWTCEAQNHLLKYINSGTNPPPLIPPQYDSSTATDAQMRNTMDQFARAERLCVQGMWALYNTTNYGEGVEDRTTVISVRGTDIRTCTQPGQIPVLRNVQSLHYLGHQMYTMDGIFIYTQPYMLGGLWMATENNGMLPAGISGMPLGSIAVTGNGFWVICSDRGDQCNGVCINMRTHGQLFMNRNTPADNNIPWPRIVRRVRQLTGNNAADECARFPSPTQPNTRRLVQRSVHDNIEVTVFSPST